MQDVATNAKKGDFDSSVPPRLSWWRFGSALKRGRGEEWAEASTTKARIFVGQRGERELSVPQSFPWEVVMMV
jgi:hypothetical protein